MQARIAQLKAIRHAGTERPDDLSVITQPVLVANGDNDLMVDSSHSTDMARRLPNAELKIYPNSGHGGVFQHHRTFVPDALRFLAETEHQTPPGEDCEHRSEPAQRRDHLVQGRAGTHRHRAGVTYAYRELGPKGGIPVIFFVHLAANLDNWDPRIIDPIARQHHVIAFDNRGVGASTGTVPDTIEAMADDAVTFITALGFDTVDIFSFSLGGMVAQALVVKHPELVRKLILTGTGPAGGKDIDKVAGITYYDMLRATLTRKDPKEFLFFNRNATGKAAAKAFVERLEERTVDRDKPVTVKAFRTQLKAIKRWGRSTPADLSTITQPTLIANGDNDRMVPSVLSEDLHRRIKGSELIIYPDSGHGGIFQFHDQFVPVAIEFLDD